MQSTLALRRGRIVLYSIACTVFILLALGMLPSYVHAQSSCAGVTCSPTCIGDSYVWGGYCIAGSCYYSYGTPGSPSCTAPDPCAGVSCGDYCSGYTYVSGGYCSGGSCYYTGSQGNSSSCGYNACAGVTCSPYCDGYTYVYGGYCSGGGCYYSYGAPNSASCGYTPPDPCAGVTCGNYCSGYVYNSGGSCSGGTCSYSTQYYSSICGYTYPETPSGLSATAAPTQINLSWSTSPHATAYNVYRCTGSGCAINENNYIGWNSSPSYTDTGVSCGTTYTYEAKAYDNIPMFSSFSGGVSATMGACVCTPGATRTRYQSSSVACGTACPSETQTCNSTGTGWSGSYTGTSCSASTRTMYQSSSVACGGTCGSQTQTCQTNGSWNGSYTYSSCSVNSCVSAPGSISSGTIGVNLTPGRPAISGSLSNTGDGYYLVRCDANDANCVLAASGSGTSFSVTSLTCPTTYKLHFYAYNTDTSLGGATDSSCTNTVKAKLPSLDASNKKCSSPTDVNAKINYCTQGFFFN